VARKYPSPRSKFLSKFDDHRLAAVVWDVMIQASNHDPDLLKAIRNLDRQIEKLYSRMELVEHRLDRIGAPQYRKV
jgi:hypothetical protein